MNQRMRYTVNDVSNTRFYQMPKFLFEGKFRDGLGNDAKVLYSLLRDRHELSLSNNWINENNEVYLIYSREKMADMVGVSQPTLRKAIAQLKKLGLMDEERIGLNKANRIYLTSVSVENTGVKNSYTPDCKNLSFKTEKSLHSRTVNSFTHDRKNFSPNDTYINQTNSSDTDISQSVSQ